MTALKMRAFSQFDNIEVQVVIGEENKIVQAQNVLNQFCNQQDDCNRDVRLLDCINRGSNTETLVANLISKCNMTSEQAHNLLHRIVDCCHANYVYMYTNMFSTANI